MSSFLPESLLNPTQNPSTLTAVQAPDQPVDDSDVALMQKVFSAAAKRPQSIPEDFMSYLQDWLQIQKLEIPIGQVQGFTQFTATVATTITTEEATSSATYTDLTTVGPTVSGLSDGQYLLMYGVIVDLASGTDSVGVGPSLNGATPTSSNSVVVTVPSSPVGVSNVVSVRLSNGGSNTAKLQYKSNGTTSVRFMQRYLAALKFANV